MKYLVTIIQSAFFITFLVSCEERETKNEKKTTTDFVEKIKDDKVSSNESISDYSESYNADIDAAVEITNVVPIRYHDYGNSSNQTSTVTLKVYWRNITSKTIKYIHCKMRAYNGVGDYITSSDNIDDSFLDGRMTGPFDPADNSNKEELFRTYGSYWWQWGNLWNNYNIAGAEFKIVKIEFMDGSVITGSGKLSKGQTQSMSY